MFPRHSKRCATPPRGFTIPEMLAVVAIITIILSILMPNLGRGRDVARKAMCASNLHQQSMAMINYTVNSNHYPGHAARSEQNRITAVWPTRIRVYGNDSNMFNCPSAPTGFNWKPVTGSPGGVFATQNDSRNWDYKLGERLLVINGGEGMPFTYAYNDWGATNGQFNPQRGLGGDLNFGWQVTELRKSLVASPSSMIAMGDNVNDGNWDFNLDPTNPSEGVGKLHFDGANIVFCDGHIEWDLQTKWMNVNTGTVPGQEMARKWNNHNKYTADQN